MNVYSAGKGPLLQIRNMGTNRRPHLVNIGPMLRTAYIIHYVTSGRGFYNGNLVETGQGFLITPGHVVEYIADPNDPWELLWVTSDDETMLTIFSTFDVDEKTGIFTYDYVSAARHTGDLILLMPKRVVSCTEILELFLGVYKHHDRSILEGSEQSRMKNYVELALYYIHHNYQSSISIEELTELLGVSQSYLFRIFKTVIGKSPKQYLSDYRLLQAKKLLRETSLPVNQVAALVGYSDAFVFSKFFTARQGISPQKYRQTITNAEMEKKDE